ncbi:MAG TPA: LacI family DNA-binding transcriptional regulator [bacterium]|nr:LacI family DNA-binding transcriptional regulator [bacterium]
MATIRDVAAEAGVSVATAARVLGGYGRVSHASRERVMLAAKTLDYTPSSIARSMIKGYTDTVAVIVSDNANPFFAAVVRGIENVVLAHGYSLLFFNADEDPHKEVLHLRTIREKRVDGLVLSPSSGPTDEFRSLAATGIPIVQVDRKLDGLESDAVLVDNRAGVRAGMEHLLALGHRRIGIITGPRRHYTGRERLEGYREAVRATGLPIEDELILEGDFKQQSGYTLVREFLELRPRPTGILVANNLMTIGALLRLQEAGIAIPRDMSVIGFDDMDWAPILTPPLTTIAQPAYSLGTAAAQLLIDRLRLRGSSQPQTIVFQPRLVVRASTATPP